MKDESREELVVIQNPWKRQRTVGIYTSHSSIFSGALHRSSTYVDNANIEFEDLGGLPFIQACLKTKGCDCKGVHAEMDITCVSIFLARHRGR